MELFYDNYNIFDWIPSNIIINEFNDEDVVESIL